MEREAKKYEELTITDDFMFGKVMQDPGRCKRLLEIILGVKIRKVVFLDEQDSMDPEYGAKYAALRKSYVIFICRFDLFGKGRHIYHFENLCREDPAIRLNDGTETIFLNTKGFLDDTDADLGNLLAYFESQIPQDEYTKELDDAVGKAKLHREWRREYMKREVLEWINQSKGWAEGREYTLINMVCKKIAKDKTPDEIADELEEEIKEIQRIYDVAVKYAPEYDVKKIYEELRGRADEKQDQKTFVFKFRKQRNMA